MPLRSREGNWHYRFWVDGREYTGNTGVAAGERNVSAAMRVEAKARELVTCGRSHELRILARPFSAAASEFLAWADGENPEHPNTAKRLRTSFVSLMAFFGSVPVSSILRGHVNDFKSWRRKEHGVREITIRHDLHALSKAFGYWVDHNWARENPVNGVEIPSDKDAVRMHILTAREEEIYFAAASRNAALVAVGRIMLNQGCRPDEVLGLRIPDIDMEARRVTIRSGKSEAARRCLRLTVESLEICARRIEKAKSAWLFEGRRPGARLVKLNGSHDKILDGLAVCACTHFRNQHKGGQCPCGCDLFSQVASGPAFVMYDFRHTFATRAAEAGMPIATLAAILGHADLRSVGKYVHVRQEAQDLAMDKLDQKNS